MNAPYTPDPEFEQRLSRKLLDVLIRAGLVFVVAFVCYRIFSPFIALMAWSTVLAVTLYPAHQKLARRMGGKQGLAATLLVLACILLIGVPTALLMASLGDSLQNLVAAVRGGTLKIPAPPAGLDQWPLVGKRIHELWSQAYNDLPALVQSVQPQVRELARQTLQVVASIAGAVLLFVFAFVVAGIIMAWGQSGARAVHAIFVRLVGIRLGDDLARLSTATIRAVALGVLGVAFIQAIVIGLIMMAASVPFTGLLALGVLVIGIVQVPALLVTIPVIVYLWASGAYSSAAAIAFSVLLLLGGMIDNVLKPLLLGRGVKAPMAVILLGALGGLASTGLLGMFVGAAFLALSYQAFMWWVANSPDVVPATVPEAAAPE